MRSTTDQIFKLYFIGKKNNFIPNVLRRGRIKLMRHEVLYFIGDREGKGLARTHKEGEDTDTGRR